MKKRLNESNLKIVLIITLLLLMSVSIAYALMQTTLYITFSNVKQDALKWEVVFEGPTATPTEITPTVLGTSDTGRVCGKANVTSTRISLNDITLSKPSDGCIYEITVKNKGTIDAQLATITAKNPASTSCTGTGPKIECGNITYKLTTDFSGNTLLPIRDNDKTTVTKNNGTKTIYLHVNFNKESEISTTAVTQTGAEFSLLYEQC